MVLRVSVFVLSSEPGYRTCKQPPPTRLHPVTRAAVRSVRQSRLSSISRALHQPVGWPGLILGGGEGAVLPLCLLAVSSLSLTISYKCSVSALHNHPLTAIISLFFLPPQHKMCPAERRGLDASAVLELTNAGGSDRKGEGRRTERWLELRGYINRLDIRDLRLNQAVTTCFLSNRIVLAALRERRPF